MFLIYFIFLASKCYKPFTPGLAKSNVASFYYDQNKDLCQITFKGTPPSSNKNVFWDVESCKKECKTDKHNYEEVF